MESGNVSFSALREGFRKLSTCSKEVLSSKNNGKNEWHSLGEATAAR